MTPSGVRQACQKAAKKGRVDRPPFRELPSYHCGGGISFSTWIAATSSEPSGSFGAPATNTFKPGLRSALVPGTVVAMIVFGVTTIFFSSSGLPWTLYLTVSIWPSTPAIEVCNEPLVMKLFGIKSQSAWNELKGCPAGAMRSSTASSVPAGRGREVIGTLASALTSAREALTTPRMAAVSLSTSLSSAPSRDLTAKLLPSSFSMVPRTRTFCAWAETALSANVAANTATTKTRDVILISFLPHSRCARSKLAHPIVLRIVAGLSHETTTRHRRGRAGRQPDRGQPPSTKAENIVDKSVLWKPCGAGGDKGASFDHNRPIHGDNSGAIWLGC